MFMSLPLPVLKIDWGFKFQMKLLFVNKLLQKIVFLYLILLHSHFILLLIVPPILTLFCSLLCPPILTLFCSLLCPH